MTNLRRNDPRQKRSRAGGGVSKVEANYVRRPDPFDSIRLRRTPLRMTRGRPDPLAALRMTRGRPGPSAALRMTKGRPDPSAALRMTEGGQILWLRSG